MIILKNLYINPIVDLSYVFHRFHEILRDEYNSFYEYCVFVKDRYIIYASEDLNISSIKLSFISNYAPSLKCNNTSYYLSNPNDADISGIVHLFVNDCKHYDCQHIKIVDNRDKSSMHPDIWEKYTMNDPFFNFSKPKLPALTKVISSGPATIAFWDDGTKTVVKCDEEDIYSAKVGILYSVIRKCIGEGKSYHNFLEQIDRFEQMMNEQKFKEKKYKESFKVCENCKYYNPKSGSFCDNNADCFAHSKWEAKV